MDSKRGEEGRFFSRRRSTRTLPTGRLMDATGTTEVCFLVRHSACSLPETLDRLHVADRVKVIQSVTAEICLQWIL